MFGKLAAVVRGDGLQRLPLVRQEQPLDGLGQRLRFLSVPEFFHEQEIRTPFRECEDGVAVLVHDDIHFPIAETFAVGFRRTLVWSHADGMPCACTSSYGGNEQPVLRFRPCGLWRKLFHERRLYPPVPNVLKSVSETIAHSLSVR